jgi:hypothetical protein
MKPFYYIYSAKRKPMKQTPSATVAFAHRNGKYQEGILKM